MSRGYRNNQHQPGAMSATDWQRLRAYLAMAMDAVGNEPRDLSPDFLANCHMHLRSAFGIANRILAEREAAQAPDGDTPPATPADLIQTYLATVSAQLPHAAMPWAVAPLYLAVSELRKAGGAA